jgi:ribosome-associated protein
VPIRRQEQTRPRPARKKEGVADEARLAARALAEHKAQDVLILDLRGLSEAADFFVIASGTSDTHVRAAADHAIATLAGAGRTPHHEEGLTQGRWVLLDFVDFVVHVFHPAQRDFYQLERLWADAPRLAADGGREG